MNTKTSTNYSLKPAAIAPLNGVAAMGVAGAVVTGSVTAAREFRTLKENPEQRGEALVKVGKESLGGGIAWAAGAAVAKTLFRSNLLGIIAMVAVSAGVKYAYDGLLASKETKVQDNPATPAKKA